MHSMHMSWLLGPDFKLKAYTPPFTMEADLAAGTGALKMDERFLAFEMATSNSGKEHVEFVYTSGGDVVISQVPVEEMLTWMI